jgi:hypothetical protein
MLNSSFINIYDYNNDPVIINDHDKNLSLKILKNEHKDSGYKIIVNDTDVFSIADIINYVIDKGNDIIEKYICKKRNGILILHNYENSPVMGNLKILIHIYNGLREFENNIENKDRNIYIKFLTAFLNHILKIILYINENIKDITEQVKHKLLNYSIMITYQLLQFTKEEFGKKEITNEKENNVFSQDNNYLSGDSL